MRDALSRWFEEISKAAGTRDGMVGGQVADLEAEGKPVTAEELGYIHRSKTAALIRASVVAGAICGEAGPEDIERLRRFGNNIGWAFQVVDDILDVEESSAALGKTAGKDQAQQKATYPALFGLPKSHEFAKQLATSAIAELDVLRQQGCASARTGGILGVAPGVTLRRRRFFPFCHYNDSLLEALRRIRETKARQAKN